MKRLLSLMRKDIKLSRKDHLISYIIIAPIFIAVLMRLFLPSMENMEITFAVSKDLESNVVSMIEEYGKVDVFDDKNQVVNRVMALDDVPGIVPTGHGYEVILEGNEISAVQELPGMILDHYAHGTFITDIEMESLGLEHTSAYFYSTAIVLFMVILIGGLAVGMTIVEERESKTILSLAVSPLGLRDYLTAKILLATLFIFALAYITAFIMMGTEIYLGALFIVVVASLPTGMLLGFILGTYAYDQMSAIAVMKVLLLLFTGLPMASLFIGDNWHVLFYPFMNYWALQSLVALVSNDFYYAYTRSAWGLLTAILPLIFILNQMKKKIKF